MIIESRGTGYLSEKYLKNFDDCWKQFKFEQGLKIYAERITEKHEKDLKKPLNLIKLSQSKLKS